MLGYHLNAKLWQEGAQKAGDLQELQENDSSEEVRHDPR